MVDWLDWLLQVRILASSHQQINKSTHQQLVIFASATIFQLKKIIFTVTNDLSYDQRMMRICGTLPEAGFDVKLVGRRLPGSKELKSRPYRQERLRCWFAKGKLFYLEYNLRLFFYLIFTRFDAVCSIDLDTLASGFLAAKLKGKPCIYDAHEYFTEVPEVSRRPRIKRIWEKLAGLIIPRIGYAYTVGPGLAGLLKQQYGVSFEVIRNLPVSSKEITRPDPAGPKILLYQGRLNEARGLEAAIDAMAWLDGCELWLAGEGDLSQLLRTRVVEKGLADKVKFLGYLSPEILKMTTLKAHLGLNLLENNGLSYYYSLANKAFDYIQAGLPSLQMDFPEYRQLQDDYGVFELVEDLEPQKLADIVRSLLNNPVKYQAIRQNCLKARTELCWEKEAGKLLAFYKGVFEAGGR